MYCVVHRASVVVGFLQRCADSWFFGLQDLCTSTCKTNLFVDEGGRLGLRGQLWRHRGAGYICPIGDADQRCLAGVVSQIAPFAFTVVVGVPFYLRWRLCTPISWATSRCSVLWWFPFIVGHGCEMRFVLLLICRHVADRPPLEMGALRSSFPSAFRKSMYSGCSVAGEIFSSDFCWTCGACIARKSSWTPLLHHPLVVWCEDSMTFWFLTTSTYLVRSGDARKRLVSTAPKLCDMSLRTWWWAPRRTPSVVSVPCAYELQVGYLVLCSCDHMSYRSITGWSKRAERRVYGWGVQCDSGKFVVYTEVIEGTILKAKYLHREYSRSYKHNDVSSDDLHLFHTHSSGSHDAYDIDGISVRGTPLKRIQTPEIHDIREWLSGCCSASISFDSWKA